jgi:hypothetical protein
MARICANLPFLDRKAALARLLCATEAGILLNEHIAESGPTVFAHACRLWNAAHISQGCSKLALNNTGGAGRIYCFAVD